MELKPQDLVVGNYIQWNEGDLAQIRYILPKAIGLMDDIESDLATPLKFFKPIELTEQWLLDFGLKKSVKTNMN